MRIAIYKDTLANRRGADKAVISLAEALREKLGVRCQGSGVSEEWEVVLFEKAELEERLKEHWDVFIVTGTNELLDLADRVGVKSSSSRKEVTPPLYNYNSNLQLNHKFPFPIIMQFHTNPKSQFKWKRFRRNRKIKAALRQVDAIQVLRSEYVKQVEKYCANVVVIGNWSGFNHIEQVDRVNSSCRSELELESGLSNVLSRTRTSNSNYTIIYPAAFAKGKNQKLLMKSFARVAKEFPDWKLRLLGRAEGRYAEDCKRLVEKLGLTDRVEFPGYSNDMAKEYAECAFVAFPSVDEGFPLTLVDAAAFGKPAVMVEDWIGLENEELRMKNEEWWSRLRDKITLDSRSVNNNGRCVITKPIVKAYAEGLRRLMGEAELCQKMGENAHAYCAEHYSRDKIIDKWVKLLEEVAR